MGLGIKMAGDVYGTAGPGMLRTNTIFNATGAEALFRARRFPGERMCDGMALLLGEPVAN